MTTVIPAAPLPLPTTAPDRDHGFALRPARAHEGPALAALSEPFVRTGALRGRPLSFYAARTSDFLVAQAPDGALEGCLGQRGSTAGVLYNFCVAGHRQGSGIGSRLLHAAITRARSRALPTLFTATTGSGRLFLRHGFVPAHPGQGPSGWLQSLDPSRNARILTLNL